MPAKEFTEEALVLKVGTFRENDCWVRLITPSQGLITGFAFGGKKSRRRFCGCLDPFNQVLFRFSLSKRGEYIALEEGSLLHSFRGIRHDVNRMGMAVNCLKFIEIVQKNHQGCSSLYDFFLESLTYLDEHPEVSSFFPILFRARLVFDQGYTPKLSKCSTCSQGLPAMDRALFSIDEGTIYCQQCLPSGGRTIPVSAETLHFLQMLLKQGPFVCNESEQPTHVHSEVYSLMDSYIQYHMGLISEGCSFRSI